MEQAFSPRTDSARTTPRKSVSGQAARRQPDARVQLATEIDSGNAAWRAGPHVASKVLLWNSSLTYVPFWRSTEAGGVSLLP